LRRAQQNQGRRNGHQQQMLQHVDRKQRIVKRIQRGANREPQEHDSSEKSGTPPKRKQFRKRGTQAKPASGVNEGGEAQRDIKSQGSGPRLQDGMSSSIHKTYG
jgi:hypothetical protein